MASETRANVVTYQAPGGASIDLCPRCAERLTREGAWPRDGAGREMCQVSHGLHAGYCDESTHRACGNGRRGTVEVAVLRHVDGSRLGSVTMDAAEWDQYAAGEHPACQWPEGIAEAGDVLTGDQVNSLGITPGTVVYLD